MSECIAVKSLEMRFPGCEALRGVDLSVQSGQVFALLGENGAGKTTLIKILTGFQMPTKGSCEVCGLDPAKQALEIRRKVGYVADAPSLYDWMRVGEIGWFAAAFYPEGFLAAYQELVTRFELPIDRKIKALSKGQRAKVALALAVAHDPELLILDEPTSGLDPLVRREFLESMVDRASQGKTVFLSSHQIAEVERVADRVAILHQGKVRWQGALSELRDTVSEVMISLADPLVDLPAPEGGVEILSDQLEGRQRRWIVKGFRDEMVSQIEASVGVIGVRSRPATLEELFVACTRGEGMLPVDPKMSGTLHRSA